MAYSYQFNSMINICVACKTNICPYPQRLCPACYICATNPQPVFVMAPTYVPSLGFATPQINLVVNTPRLTLNFHKNSSGIRKCRCDFNCENSGSPALNYFCSEQCMKGNCDHGRFRLL